MKALFPASLSFWLMAAWVGGSPALHAQFAGFTNHGLVAAGRLSGESFDAYGTNLDTLGGIFSGMSFDPASWSRMTSGDSLRYQGTLYCVPDRGYGPGVLGGTFDYKPRIHTLTIAITPYYGTAATNQSQIKMSNTETRLLLDESLAPFTGFSGNDLAFTDYPKSATNSAGEGRHSLDPEGLARARDGGFFIGDEYGPFIYKFNSNAALEFTLKPPEAWIPKVGASYPRTNNFTSVTGPDSGRKNNRGVEAIGLAPNERTLFALLQAPLVQDGGEDNGSRYVRLLVWDLAPESPTRNQLTAEYVYELTLNGNANRTRQTITSELVALNSHQLLVLERDQRGRNSGSTSAMIYKQVVLVDLEGATNILGSGYDLELGAPGQTSFPLNGLPTEIRPVAHQDFVNLLDTAQLSKFGLNLDAASPDTNTMVEKWEGMTLVPLNDPAAPDDYLLLVGCDNDFGATTVYHNGVAVGTNAEVTDHILLAYRVTLPTCGLAAAPTLTIQRSGALLEICWPAAFSNFVLRSSTALTEGSWTTVRSSGNSVTVEATNTAQFFRLFTL
jgi:hypothetical protein